MFLKTLSFNENSKYQKILLWNILNPSKRYNIHKFEQNCLSGFGVQHAQRNKIIVPKSFFPPKQTPKSKSGDSRPTLLKYKCEVFLQFLCIFKPKSWRNKNK